MKQVSLGKLIRLIYYSENNPTVDKEQITYILKQSRKKNNQRFITGMLFHNENFFLQVLEGERAIVNSLYIDIASDYRHKNIVITSVSEIEHRVFEDWNMLYVNEINIDRTMMLKFFPDTRFNPLNLTSKCIESFALNIKRKDMK